MRSRLTRREIHGVLRALRNLDRKKRLGGEVVATAGEIRRRLKALIGDGARWVTVLTCHGLAMRLAGASFSGRSNRPDGEAFRDVMRQAVTLLHGEGLPPEDADEQRERLLAGFRWILVDEYQDIDADQYELISALAGRTLDDGDRKPRSSPSATTTRTSTHSTAHRWSSSADSRRTTGRNPPS